jgi:hypothetical protein
MSAIKRVTLGAAALVAVGGAAAVGFAPSAGATEAAPTAVRKPVTVNVTQNTARVATICVNDNLEGRCFDVARGKTQQFNQKQGPGEPITVNIIVSGKGSAFKQFFDSGATLNVRTGGNADKPVIQ